MKNPENEQRRQRNPLRGLRWLPPDVANLDEIDWSPLPEPPTNPTRRATRATGTPEMAEVAA